MRPRQHSKFPTQHGEPFGLNSRRLGAFAVKATCAIVKTGLGIIKAAWPDHAGALRLHVHTQDDLGSHFRDAFDRADAFTQVT